MSIKNTHYVVGTSLPASVTLPWTPTPGNTLVCALALYEGGGGLGSDGQDTRTLTQTNATWVRKLDRAQGIYKITAYVAENIGAAATAVSFSFPGTFQAAFIYFFEIENVGAISYDTVTSTKYNASSALTRAVGNITTAQNNELLLSFYWDCDLTPVRSVGSYGTGETQVHSATATKSILAVSQRLLLAAGTVNPQAVFVGAGTSYGVSASLAFKTYGTPPEKTTEPYPSLDATDVEALPMATWTGEADEEQGFTYSVYGGHTSGNLTLLFSGLLGSTYPLETTPGIRYYWRVDTVWPGGTVTGDEWQFLPKPTVIDPLMSTDGLVEETAHVEKALDKLLAQFDNSPLLRALLASYIREIQALEYAATQVRTLRWLDTAEGVQLDGLGGIVGEPRRGANDADYGLRLRARIILNRACGEPELILALMRLVLPNGTDFLLEEQFPHFIRVTVFDTPDDLNLDVVHALVRSARAATIRTELWWSTLYPFTFSSSGSVEISATLGFGDIAQTTGGKLSGLLRD